MRKIVSMILLIALLSPTTAFARNPVRLQIRLRIPPIAQTRVETEEETPGQENEEIIKDDHEQIVVVEKTSRNGTPVLLKTYVIK